MRTFLKKGFTLVELSIVVAIIAILAAVLIPTFANAVKDSELKTVRVAAEEEISFYLADQINVADTSGDYIVTYGGYAFVVDDGVFDDTAYDLSDGNPEGEEVALTCGTTYTSITITLVTNEDIKSTTASISTTAVDVEVTNGTEAVITVNAAISTGDSGKVCTVKTITAGDGKITSGNNSEYSYLHKDAAIYVIKYS